MPKVRPTIRNIDPSFRGWTKPGPLPDVEAMHAVPLEDGETLDALCGHWRIFQLRDGHRFSTDDIMTAWYGTSWCPSARTILDLGSGLGTAAMIAAWRLPGARMVTVEAQEMSWRLAQKSLAYNGLLDRVDARLGDLRDPAVLDPEARFDLIMGTPPYFPLGTGVHAEHPQKLACRFEVRGDVADYCATAARHLAPGGVLSLVFPCRPEAHLERLEAGAAQAGLHIVRRRPLTLREQDGPLLTLALLMRASDLPEPPPSTWVEPQLIVRCADGSLHPEYAAVKLAIGFPP